MNFVLCVFTMLIMRFLESAYFAGTLESTGRCCGFQEGASVGAWGAGGRWVEHVRDSPVGAAPPAACAPCPLTPRLRSAYLRLTSGADASLAMPPVLPFATWGEVILGVFV